MLKLDPYIVHTLLRDLSGHDRRPASFLVYLWLTAETEQRGGDVQISYQELAENVGLSKSATQDAVRWLIKRRLLAAKKKNATAIPAYRTLTPWKNR